MAEIGADRFVDTRRKQTNRRRKKTRARPRARAEVLGGRMFDG